MKPWLLSPKHYQRVCKKWFSTNFWWMPRIMDIFGLWPYHNLRILYRRLTLRVPFWVINAFSLWKAFPSYIVCKWVFSASVTSYNITKAIKREVVTTDKTFLDHFRTHFLLNWSSFIFAAIFFSSGKKTLSYIKLFLQIIFNNLVFQN